MTHLLTGGSLVTPYLLSIRYRWSFLDLIRIDINYKVTLDTSFAPRNIFIWFRSTRLSLVAILSPYREEAISMMDPYPMEHGYSQFSSEPGTDNDDAENAGFWYAHCPGPLSNMPISNSMASDGRPNEILPDHTWDSIEDRLDDISELGYMDLRIKETRYCRISGYTGVHLQRSVGTLQVYIYAQHLNLHSPVSLRGQLVRANAEYRHIPVSFVCGKHISEAGVAGRRFVLQAAPDTLNRVSYSIAGARPSVIYDLGYPDAIGRIEARVNFRSICHDCCATADELLIQARERARDLVLLLTLRSTESGVLIARRAIPLWIKASIRRADLNRTERRKRGKGLIVPSTPSEYHVNFRMKVGDSDPYSAWNYHLQELVLEAQRLGIGEMDMVAKVRTFFSPTPFVDMTSE